MSGSGDTIMQGDALTWLGQAGFRLRLDGLEILIDPFTSDHEARLTPMPDLVETATRIDWLLITHDHLDHFDDGCVSVLASYSPGASIVVPHPLVPKAEALAPELPVVGVGPGDSLELAAGVHLRCIPAWHAAEVGDGYSQGLGDDGASSFVGYIISTPEIALYHSGDTLVTDDLRRVLAREQIDVALLPVNGRDYFREAAGLVGNMDGREAVQLATELGVALLVPMHWDLFAGNTVRPGAVVDEAAEDARLPVLVPARFVTFPLPRFSHVPPV
jgi:L-ascorbate 6-phosphate lactonase